MTSNLIAELEASTTAIAELDEQISKLVKESKDGEEDSQDVKDIHILLGGLVVKVITAKVKHAQIERQIAEYNSEHRQYLPSDNNADNKQEIVTQEFPGHSFLNDMPSLHVQSKAQIAKPPKFKVGQDICIFLDRFEQYMIISGDSYVNNLDLRLLNLVEDDKMYRKFKSILNTIKGENISSVTKFTAAIRSVLYPDAESRTLRDAMYKLRQNPDENVEDFALRIETEAAKAFSPLEHTLKNEACLSALGNGLRSVEVRRKLKESELKLFDVATRLAIKHEHILISTQDHEDVEPVSQLTSSFEVLRIDGPDQSRVPHTNYRTVQNNTQNNSRRSERPMICYNCNQPGHIARFCRNIRSDQYRNEQDVRSCNICHRTNHHTNQCWSRNQNRYSRNSGANTSSRVNNNQRNSLNGNTAGEFTVHPSRLN